MCPAQHGVAQQLLERRIVRREELEQHRPRAVEHRRLPRGRGVALLGFDDARQCTPRLRPRQHLLNHARAVGKVVLRADEEHVGVAVEAIEAPQRNNVERHPHHGRPLVAMGRAALVVVRNTGRGAVVVVRRVALAHRVIARAPRPVAVPEARRDGRAARAEARRLVRPTVLGLPGAAVVPHLGGAVALSCDPHIDPSDPIEADRPRRTGVLREKTVRRLVVACRGKWSERDE